MVDQTQTELTTIAGADNRLGEKQPRSPRYLFGPIIDFLCLGGGSVIVLAAIVLFMPVTPDAKAGLAAAMLYLAHLVNHPHFAHSYQIFYSDFAEKAFGSSTPKLLRIRYIIAGIVVPAGLVAFLVAAVLLEDAALLGAAGNIMLLTVGWHYAKQGYGMVMVDSVLKRRFFNALEKRLLIFNTHACWIVFWLTLNSELSQRDLFGFNYYSVAIPGVLLWSGYIVITFSSLATAAILFRKWQSGGGLPVNGVAAYVVTIYVWMFIGLKDPVLLFVVPAFHSLQYLVVVWRFQINQTRDRLENAGNRLRGPVSRFLPQNLITHMTIFIIGGILLGFFGFWGAPFLLSTIVPYDSGIFSSALFLFMFWVFINIHHYFLDNVMWRRENPTTKKYLFV